jgi:hypothetical protein
VQLASSLARVHPPPYLVLTFGHHYASFPTKLTRYSKSMPAKKTNHQAPGISLGRYLETYAYLCLSASKHGI